MTSSPMPKAIELRKIDDHAIECDFLISEDLVFFPGHFPVQSVLPGVVIIDWAIALGKEHFGINPSEFGSMEVVKFKQLVTPGKIVTFHIKYLPEKKKLVFTVDSPEAEYSSGKINLNPSVSEH